MIKVVDCFIFYNELDLLTYRLNVLNDTVDYFIIVESTHTHVGKEKKLYFTHQEFNNSNYTDLDKIEDRVKNGRDLFETSNLDIIKIEDNKYLPVGYDKYLSKYYN